MWSHTFGNRHQSTSNLRCTGSLTVHNHKWAVTVIATETLSKVNAFMHTVMVIFLLFSSSLLTVLSKTYKTRQHRTVYCCCFNKLPSQVASLRGLKLSLAMNSGVQVSSHLLSSHSFKCFEHYPQALKQSWYIPSDECACAKHTASRLQFLIYDSIPVSCSLCLVLFVGGLL